LEISKWDAVCYLLSSTGLILMAVSFAAPWYNTGAEKFYIFQTGSSELSGRDIIQEMHIAQTCLAFGMLFGWMFLVASFLGSGRASAAFSWLSEGLLAAGMVYVLSKAASDLGWYVGFFALVLIGIAATSELNKVFWQPTPEVQTGPFLE
jgi:hypothetical protein